MKATTEAPNTSLNLFSAGFEPLKQPSSRL